MKRFHVTLSDELGEEFSVQLNASDRYEAWDRVAEEYPEFCVVSVRELKPYYRR